MKKKYFNIRFKQDGIKYELQEIPYERLEHSRKLIKTLRKLKKTQGIGSHCKNCEKCPFDPTLYDDVKGGCPEVIGDNFVRSSLEISLI